jgi:hypothetical protein
MTRSSAASKRLVGHLLPGVSYRPPSGRLVIDSGDGNTSDAQVGPTREQSLPLNCLRHL